MQFFYISPGYTEKNTAPKHSAKWTKITQYVIYCTIFLFLGHLCIFSNLRTYKITKNYLNICIIPQIWLVDIRGRSTNRKLSVGFHRHTYIHASQKKGQNVVYYYVVYSHEIYIKDKLYKNLKLFLDFVVLIHFHRGSTTM